METKQFNWIIGKRCDTIKEVLCKKAEEYASEEDRLHNFKSAVGFTKLSPEQSLWGMATKHFVSVKDIVDKCQDPNYRPKQELMLEKIGDSINYLILLEALLTERISESKDDELPF